MDALLAALEALGPAQFLRVSRWGYAAVNGAHILGIALLVGSVVPMNLRLLGLWSGTPRPGLMRVLMPVAASGLSLAVLAGALLFTVRAREYAGMPVFQAKLVLIAAATLSAVLLLRAHGRTLKGAAPGRLRVHALLSVICWIGALACGRLIAFAQ